jgi:hypothetical protein
VQRRIVFSYLYLLAVVSLVLDFLKAHNLQNAFKTLKEELGKLFLFKPPVEADLS